MRRLTIPLTVAAVLAAALPARGEWKDLRRGGLSVGGHYSWIDPTGAGAQDSSGGAQFRLYATHLALEAMGDYRRRDIGPVLVREFPLSGSIVFYLFEKPLSPFVMGGIDWVVTDISGPAGFDDTQHRVGGHVGGGIHLMATRTWSLEAAYRHVFIEDIRDVDTAVPSRFDDNFHWVTLGLNIHFGARE